MHQLRVVFGYPAHSEHTASYQKHSHKQFRTNKRRYKQHTSLSTYQRQDGHLHESRVIAVKHNDVCNHEGNRGRYTGESVKVNKDSERVSVDVSDNVEESNHGEPERNCNRHISKAVELIMFLYMIVLTVLQVTQS